MFNITTPYPILHVPRTTLSGLSPVGLIDLSKYLKLDFQDTRSNRIT